MCSGLLKYREGPGSLVPSGHEPGWERDRIEKHRRAKRGLMNSHRPGPDHEYLHRIPVQERKGKNKYDTLLMFVCLSVRSFARVAPLRLQFSPDRCNEGLQLTR